MIDQDEGRFGDTERCPPPDFTCTVGRLAIPPPAPHYEDDDPETLRDFSRLRRPVER